MNRILSICVLIVLICGIDAISQENAAKVNLTGFLFGSNGVAFERVIEDVGTVQLNVGLLSRTRSVLDFDYDYSGFFISPEFRYYFDEPLTDYYLGAFFLFNSVKEEQFNKDIDAGTTKFTNTTFGVQGGRQWRFGTYENILLDVGISAGYQSTSIDDVEQEDNLEWTLIKKGFLPRLSIAAGYAF